MLLLLAEDNQIVSLSNLSHHEAGSYYYKEARKFPVNKSEAEKILLLEPDLVIVSVTKLLREQNHYRPASHAVLQSKAEIGGRLPVIEQAAQQLKL